MNTAALFATPRLVLAGFYFLLADLVNMHQVGVIDDKLAFRGFVKVINNEGWRL